MRNSDRSITTGRIYESFELLLMTIGADDLRPPMEYQWDGSPDNCPAFSEDEK